MFFFRGVCVCLHLEAIRPQDNVVKGTLTITLGFTAKSFCPPTWMCFFMRLKWLKRQMSRPLLFVLKLKSTSSQKYLSNWTERFAEGKSLQLAWCLFISHHKRKGELHWGQKPKNFRAEMSTSLFQINVTLSGLAMPATHTSPDTGDINFIEVVSDAKWQQQVSVTNLYWHCTTVEGT